MFTQTSYLILENSLEELSVCVQLLGELELSIRIDISVNEGTATTDDYSTANTVFNFTFDAGLANIQCLEVDIMEDSLLENDESFSFVLSSQVDDVVNIVNGTALVTIQDSSELVIGFEKITYNVTEGNELEFCVVTLIGSLDVQFSLPLNIIVLNGQGMLTEGAHIKNDNAISGLVNEQNVAFTLTQGCATVSVLDDGIVESSDSFTLELVSTAGVQNDRITVDPSLAVVTVMDNDCKFIHVEWLEFTNNSNILLTVVDVSFQFASYTMSEEMGSIQVCILLSGQVLRPVSMQLFTTQGSALSGQDNDFISIDDVRATTLPMDCITLDIIFDDVVESDETFTVNLQSVAEDPAVIIVQPNMATVSITDSSTVGFSFSSDVYTVIENASVPVCAQLEGNTDRNITLAIVISSMGKKDMSSV